MKICISVLLAITLTTANALEILKYTAGIISEVPASYDLNGDGVIDSADALLALQIIAGIVEEEEDEVYIRPRGGFIGINTPDSGVLENGIRYEFVLGDTNLNDLLEQHDYVFTRNVDGTVIARTPREAVELGSYYLNRSLFSSMQVNDFIVYVHYCRTTGNWFLRTRQTNAHLVSAVATPYALAIDYFDGSMVRYHWSGAFICDREREWNSVKDN
jgi:hypothetical protein